MKYFSVPADFRLETIDRYERLNRAYSDCQVIETYGNINAGNFLGSGRSIDQLPDTGLSRLEEYVGYSKERGIDFNYTLNASHMQNKEFTRKGMVEIMMFLGNLYQAGVRSLTVALPSLMEIVKQSKYTFKMKASVICQITSPNKALMYKKLGAERIVVDEYLNRSFQSLKRIKDAFGDNIEIIVNSICFKDCASRMFHYNQISTDSIEIASEASADYYDHKCLVRRFENVGNLLRLSWIRPEDIKYYTAVGIKYFKLQGRHTVLKGDPQRAVECYFKESYEGDLMELLDMFNPTSQFRVAIDNKKLDGFLKPFHEDENFCKNDCRNCNYCESFARKCIDGSEVEKLRLSINDFFHQYDRFDKMLDSLKTEPAEKDKRDDLEVDFDLN